MKPYKVLLLRIAEIYGEALTENRLNYYAELLSGYALADVEAAMRKIVMDPKVTRFPLPAVVLERLGATVTDDQLAVEAAARIVTAITRYGWNNPADAKKYIGELGWAVVMKQGGWVDLCENLSPKQVQAFQAQARELAKSQLSQARAGVLDRPPALPGAEAPQISTAPQRIAELLPGHKNSLLK